MRRDVIYLDWTETEYQLQEHSLGTWGLPLFVLRCLCCSSALPPRYKQGAHIPLKQDESFVCKQATGASLRCSVNAVVAACTERGSAKS